MEYAEARCTPEDSCQVRSYFTAAASGGAPRLASHTAARLDDTTCSEPHIERALDSSSERSLSKRSRRRGRKNKAHASNGSDTTWLIPQKFAFAQGENSISCPILRPLPLLSLSTDVWSSGDAPCRRRTALTLSGPGSVQECDAKDVRRLFARLGCVGSYSW